MGDRHPHQPQGRVAHDSGHAPHLAVFAFL
jgi:hypothetical protein